jgi:hypothetical protein
MHPLPCSVSKDFDRFDVRFGAAKRSVIRQCTVDIHDADDLRL